jgi:EAL domain-containing protein (putative c-di-GMP-specific phosphodiesterase class I)
MPFSEIKIDRSFVSEMTVSRDSRAIVKSIVDLAVNMDLDCVAEGVETEDTAGLLEQFGVRTMQGYLIARPMSAAALPAWFANWSRSDVATRHQDSAAESAPDAASTITSAAGDQVPIPGPPS